MPPCAAITTATTRAASPSGANSARSRRPRTCCRSARAVPHASLLEIGAGEGALLARLAELGFASALHAAEISESGVQAIRARGIPGLIDCRRFDGETLPWADASFDLAVLSHVLEHAEHPRRLLAEATRVARAVFVEVPLEDTWRLPRDFRARSRRPHQLLSLQVATPLRPDLRRRGAGREDRRALARGDGLPLGLARRARLRRKGPRPARGARARDATRHLPRRAALPPGLKKVAAPGAS